VLVLTGVRKVRRVRIAFLPGYLILKQATTKHNKNLPNINPKQIVNSHKLRLKNPRRQRLHALICSKSFNLGESLSRSQASA
jgi:hypothetical protein